MRLGKNHILATVLTGLVAICLRVPIAEAQKGATTTNDGGDGASADDEAKALFSAGRFAFEDGRFEDALKNFEKAYDLSKRPQLLYNIGTTADRLRLNAKALDAFKRYLAEVESPSNEREVQGRINALEKAVAEDKRKSELEAAAAATAAQEGQQPSEPQEEKKSNWWVWALVAGGAAVAIGVVIAIIVASSGGDAQPGSFQGDFDFSHRTLGHRTLGRAGS